MASCCSSKVDPEDELEELEGPLSQRSCTDILCFLIFGAFLFSMVFLFGTVVQGGDANRILRGYDVAGDVCGQNNPANPNVIGSGKNLVAQPYLYFDLELTASLLGQSAISTVLQQSSFQIPNVNLNSPGGPILYCLSGSVIPTASTGRRKRDSLSPYSEVILPTGTSQPEYDQQWAIASNLKGLPVASYMFKNDTALVVLLEPNSTFRVWRTAKASSMNASTAAQQLLTYDPVSSAITGGGACRYCVAQCPSDFNVFLSRCVPSFVSQSAGAAFTGSGAQSWLQNFAADLHTCSTQLVYMCLIAVGLSILLTALFRVLAQAIVYAIIAMVVVASLAGTLTLWVMWYLKNSDLQKSDQLAAQAQASGNGAAYNASEALARSLLGSSANAGSAQEVGYFLAGAIAASIVTVILLLIVLVMRKRLQLVVQLFREAGSAVRAMPLLVLLPLATVVVQALIVVLWGYGAIMLESNGSPQADPSTGYITYQKDNYLLGLRWYNIFGLLWLTQFCVACQHLVIAGSVAGWYFAREKESVGLPTMLAALYRLVRYHLGTVAFGSFIIALVQLVRLIMHYLESRIKAWEKNGCGAGPLVKLLLLGLKCCECIMWCFEKCMKYLNINAYIITAIYGFNFCRAAFKAMQLLTANILRVAAINSVGSFVLFLGKIFVVIGTVLCGMLIMQDVSKTVVVHYIWGPVVLAALFAYITAHCFIAVYQMAIDTIFLCFCEDLEKNDGLERPYFMSKGLMEFADNSSKALEALETREKNKDRQVLVSSVSGGNLTNVG